MPVAAKQGPLAHPPELTCPCCLPALGGFSEMTPHEGSRQGYGRRRSCMHWSLVTSSTEDSPSGLWRSLGKRVGGNPSGVQIPYPPPHSMRAPTGALICACTLFRGGVSERPKERASKARVGKLTVGSNPTATAKESLQEQGPPTCKTPARASRQGFCLSRPTGLAGRRWAGRCRILTTGPTALRAASDGGP